MSARIYKPVKNAMQSGPREKDWVLEFEPEDRKFVDPLMGWTGTTDTTRQLRLHFESREAAVAYAEKHGISYTLVLPKTRTPKPKAYADNFSFKRVRA